MTTLFKNDHLRRALVAAAVLVAATLVDALRSGALGWNMATYPTLSLVATYVSGWLRDYGKAHPA